MNGCELLRKNEKKQRTRSGLSWNRRRFSSRVRRRTPLNMRWICSLIKLKREVGELCSGLSFVSVWWTMQYYITYIQCQVQLLNMSMCHKQSVLTASKSCGIIQETKKASPKELAFMSGFNEGILPPSMILIGTKPTDQGDHGCLYTYKYRGKSRSCQGLTSYLKPVW